ASGNGPITSDPNASNGQTRGAENNLNHFVDYAVSGVPSAGTYYAKLRYYSSDAPQVAVSVNGAAATHYTLPHSGSWNIVWAEYTFAVSLNAGSNTVRIAGVGGGSCRQDRVCFSNNLRLGVEGAKAEVSTTEERSGTEEADIYPNPSGGVVVVRYYLEAGQVAKLAFSDAGGRVWHEREVKGQGRWATETTDLSWLPNGVYTLLFENSRRRVSRKLVIAK
ncbi:MAG: T9SS type A sorting domain-containing protein, partial [Runella sp.]